MSAPNFIARGNITPASVVKLDTATNHGVLLASDTAGTVKLIGVSQEGLRRAPRSDVTETYAAINGESIRIFGNGDECVAIVGTGGVTAGDVLTNEVTTGYIVPQGTTHGSTNYFTIGRALETRAAGEKCRMVVIIGVVAA